jgi:hypothetical protein
LALAVLRYLIISIKVQGKSHRQTLHFGSGIQVYGFGTRRKKCERYVNRRSLVYAGGLEAAWLTFH